MSANFENGEWAKAFSQLPAALAALYAAKVHIPSDILEDRRRVSGMPCAECTPDSALLFCDHLVAYAPDFAFVFVTIWIYRRWLCAETVEGVICFCYGNNLGRRRASVSLRSLCRILPCFV